MKTAVVYYSFKGSTKRFAENLAKERDADLFEVKEAKKRSMLGSFFSGAPAAMKQKAAALQGDPIDLNSYDTIAMAAPVWAGFPAPAFNAIIPMLPSGKTVEVFLISGGGETKSKDKVKALIEKSGSIVSGITDIKQSDIV